MLDNVLYTSDKSLLALGRYRGLPVVIKSLRTDEKFWRAKFAHEIRLYQAFSENPPSVRVPRLVHTDGHSVLIIEHIPGHAIEAERYPQQPLTASTLDAVLDTVTAFAKWASPPWAMVPVFDYPDRVNRYHRAGYFDDAERAALHTLLEQVPPPGETNHGDPLPANLLLTESGECVLLDFEFTGLFLPGFDLAMLHTLLVETPGAQDAIETLVAGAGIEVPFLLNRATVLSRELRLHTELPDGGFRQHRLALLEAEWQAFRARLI